MNFLDWNNNEISHFCLGTVQLGFDYGIANRQGKPSEEQACRIIEHAWLNGINCFDTAQGYGDSEIILGKALAKINASNQAKLVSKIDRDLDAGSKETIFSSIEKSCENLRTSQLWGLMLHEPAMIDYWEQGLGEAVISAKEKNLLKYFGISVNNLEEVEVALENDDIEIIQMPCNAWDHRMLEKKIFETAKAKNKLCFVRSIFLKGLLVLPIDEVMEKLPEAVPASKQWHELAAEYDTSAEKLAFRFGLALNCPLVVGLENIEQLDENLKFFDLKPLSKEEIDHIYQKISPHICKKIITPFLWENE